MSAPWWLWAVAAAAPPEVLSEAWLLVADPRQLQRAEQLGAVLVEGTERRADGRVARRVLLSAHARASLPAAGLEVEITREDHRRGPPRGTYRDPEQGVALLRVLAARGGGEIVQLGASVEGRPIVALRLGAHPDAGAPQWRILGGHHGDEWSSFEVALDVAETLVARDGADPGVTALLDAATVWVVPYVNPDGVWEGSRYNANQVDLNRNYEFEWRAGAYGAGATAFSEPEARAIRTLSLHDPPIAGLSLHSGAANIGYVWNHTANAAPDEALLVELAYGYAERCTRPDFWVTQGADWFRSNGDTNDWSYGRQGTLDFTVEVTREKTPDGGEIGVFVADHRGSALSFLQSPPALGGRVVDATDGAPVDALVWLTRDGSARQPSPAHPVTGAFHRLGAPGHAVLHVHAPGYHPAELPVALGAPGSLDLVVALARDRIGAAAVRPRRVHGPALLTVPAFHGTLALVRPGVPRREVSVVGGRAFLDPEGLPAGPYTVVLPDGTALPRGLFVVHDGPARPATARASASTLEITGSGFAEGTRAYGLWGVTRALVPLPVTSESAARIVVDLSAVPAGVRPDVMFVSNGTPNVVVDVEPGMWLDMGARDDTGGPLPGDTAGRESPRGACGCGGARAPWWGWLVFPLLVSRRRSA